MRPIRPLLTLAVLLVACGSDPEPAATQGPAVGSAGVSGSGGSSGATGQAGGSDAGTAGVAGSSSAGSGGTSAGVAGVGGGSSGTSGASGGGQAGTSAGQAGASGEGGSVAGAAGLGGAGGAAGGGGDAGQAGTGGAGGQVAVCKVPAEPVCDCPDPRNVFTTGTWTCPAETGEPACDCRYGEPAPASDASYRCADLPAKDRSFESACVSDAAYPSCYAVLSSKSWVTNNCATPLGGPTKAKSDGGDDLIVFCCKTPKP